MLYEIERQILSDLIYMWDKESKMLTNSRTVGNREEVREWKTWEGQGQMIQNCS
jgi:hypothetical protein